MKKILVPAVITFLTLALILGYLFPEKLSGLLELGKRNEKKRWQGMSFVKLFSFNKENALNEWREKIFKGRVLYVVKPREGNGFLLAKSEQSASGIFYKINFDPRKAPLISWKWQVSQFPDKRRIASSRGWIERDDYAARVYIIFPSFYFMNTKCLEYVWDEDLPKGKILTSPYFKNIKLIVAESGRDNLGKWVFVERNIPEDFKTAFGRPLKERVGAIAIMTDADNTASSAQAGYSEIKVGYEKNDKSK